MVRTDIEISVGRERWSADPSHSPQRSSPPSTLLSLAEEFALDERQVPVRVEVVRLVGTWSDVHSKARCLGILCVEGDQSDGRCFAQRIKASKFIRMRLLWHSEVGPMTEQAIGACLPKDRRPSAVAVGIAMLLSQK